MINLKTWKRFGIFALLGLLLSWMVSCGGGAGPGANQQGGDTQEVEFWTMQLQPKFTDYFNQLIVQFEQQDPAVTIRWVDVPWAAMESKILTAVSAGTAPDVVNLNPTFASQLASRNAWMNLDDKIPAAVRDRYLANIWDASTLDGKSFGIPWYLTTRINIYNQNILQQAGLTQPPKTYSELAAAAQQIKDRTGQYAFFTTVVPEDSGEVLESFVQMGAQLVDDQGRAAFNTPEGRAVFQYWTDLYRKGLLPEEVLTQGHRHGVELYQAGQTAFLSSGPEFLSTIANNAPAVAEVSASAPQITGETGKKNVAVMDLVIPRQTDQPDAALDFALFVTNNDNQLAFAKAANVLPSTKEALQSEYFNNAPANASPVEKARIVSANQMQEAGVLIPAMKDVKELQKVIYTNLQATMLGQKTVDQAVADAAQTWNQSRA